MILIIFCDHATRCPLVVYFRCSRYRIKNSHCKKKAEGFDDRGSFSTYQDIMHSWVGYELVKVLLNFELTPKIHKDLNAWSPDVYSLFSYLGAK